MFRSLCRKLQLYSPKLPPTITAYSSFRLWSLMHINLLFAIKFRIILPPISIFAIIISPIRLPLRLHIKSCFLSDKIIHILQLDRR